MSFDLNQLLAANQTKSTSQQIAAHLETSMDRAAGNQLSTSLESLYAPADTVVHRPRLDDAAMFAGALKASMEHLSSVFDAGKEAGEMLTTAQKQAGGIIMAIAQGGTAAISQYGRSALTTSNEQLSVTKEFDKGWVRTSVESSPTLYDYQGSLTDNQIGSLAASLEDFDNRTVNQMVTMAVEYNIRTAKQSKFSEAFFATSVVAPDVLGAVTTIPLRFVLDRVHHTTDGNPVDFKERRLIEATVNHEILAGNETKLFPQVTGESENAKFFLDAGLYVPQPKEVATRTILTAPVKFGVDFNIIGNGSHSSSENDGIPTRTDSLDPAGGLAKVTLVAGQDALDFHVGELFGSKWSQFAEGHNKDMVMMFRPVLQLSSATLKRYDGTAVTNATLKKMVDEGYVANIELDITGRINVASGNMNVRQNGFKVLEIYNSQGDKVPFTEGSGKEIYDGLVAALTVAAWYPDAALTNSNFRHTGKQANTRFFTERYPVQLGAPVTALFPHGEERGDEEMKSLVAIVRMRNDHNALTKLLSVENTLAQYDQDYLYKDGLTQVAEVEGIARHLLQRVKSVRLNLHLPDLVQSTKTSEIMSDLRAQLNNVLADTMIRLGRDIGIHQAVEHLTGYQSDKINVIFGTDQVLEHYLWREGDTRQISDKISAIVVSTPDKRMYDTIIGVFSRGVEGNDPLNFGTHYWTPEFLSLLPVSRDNAQYKEIQVRPRTRHVVNIPAMAMFKVTGLAEILQKAGIHQVAVTNIGDAPVAPVAPVTPPTGP